MPEVYHVGIDDAGVGKVDMEPGIAPGKLTGKPQQGKFRPGIGPELGEFISRGAQRFFSHGNVTARQRNHVHDTRLRIH